MSRLKREPIRWATVRKRDRHGKMRMVRFPILPFSTKRIRVKLFPEGAPPIQRTLPPPPPENALVQDGRPVARVIGWSRLRGGKETFTVSRQAVIDERQVPKSATEVLVVFFDKAGNSLGKAAALQRSQLKDYALTR